MEVAIIAPTQLLKPYATQGDIHLVLAHLVDTDSVYTNFYSQQKKFKILDNGVFENGASIPSFDLLYRASLIGANEIVLPDVLGNGEETYNQGIQFLKLVNDYTHNSQFSAQLKSYVKTIKFMGVPQSTKGNVQEYLACLNAMLEHPQINTIGLSILGIPNAFAPDAHFKEGFCPISGSRTHLLNLLYSLGLLAKAKKLKKSFHLLGMGSLFEDLILAKNLGLRSNDTSSPVVHGLQGIGYRRNGLSKGKLEAKLDFEKQYTITKQIDQRIRKNIKTYKQALK